jgi:hypothetical protein
MAVLLVTFDPNQDGQDYEGLTAFLEHYKHVFLANGSYAIETHEATRTLYNKMAEFLTKNIHYYVLTLTKPFSTQCVDDVKKWLVDHLPSV